MELELQLNAFSNWSDVLRESVEQRYILHTNRVKLSVVCAQNDDSFLKYSSFIWHTCEVVVVVGPWVTWVNFSAVFYWPLIRFLLICCRVICGYVTATEAHELLHWTTVTQLSLPLNLHHLHQDSLCLHHLDLEIMTDMATGIVLRSLTCLSCLC